MDKKTIERLQTVAVAMGILLLLTGGAALGASVRREIFRQCHQAQVEYQQQRLDSTLKEFDHPIAPTQE